MVDKLKDLIKERDKVFVRDLRLNHDERFDDKGFTDFMWNKYQLHLKKLDVQKRMQELADKITTKTFVNGPDIKIVGIVNGHEKVSYIKDTAQRRWAIINKEFRDIEREERGGFILKMGAKEVKVK